jgi:phosphatidylserine decarboxylase
MFHKEGTKTILLGIIFTATVLLLSVLTPCGLQAALQIGAFDINNHFTILETERTALIGENQILSPVDGSSCNRRSL